MQGAKFRNAYIQDADFEDANLQGAGDRHWTSNMSVEERINEAVDKDSKLETLHSGGIDQELADSLIKSLPELEFPEYENMLEKVIKDHTRLLGRKGLPENHGAITGAYTKEEAEKWIAEIETGRGTPIRRIHE